MKSYALVLALLCAAPSAALAQQGPPPPPQDRQQMMQAHEAFRSSVLHALTPEHRALLAQIVGQLAVSDKPDRDAAAKQLDSALTDSEKQNILAAATQMMTQMKAMRPSPPPGAPAHQPRTPDAGRILLMLSGGPGMMMHRMPPPPSQP